jgi:hypothetical protein
MGEKRNAYKIAENSKGWNHLEDRSMDGTVTKLGYKG